MSYVVPRARATLRTHASTPHGGGSTTRGRLWDRVCRCRVRACLVALRVAPLSSPYCDRKCLP
eukprot:scaffold380_cov332-Pavlova_lutheri.AAC.1